MNKDEKFVLIVLLICSNAAGLVTGWILRGALL